MSSTFIRTDGTRGGTARPVSGGSSVAEVRREEDGAHDRHIGARIEGELPAGLALTLALLRQSVGRLAGTALVMGVVAAVPWWLIQREEAKACRRASILECRSPR